MKPSGNELTHPPGTLVDAINCVIPEKDELMPRRGHKLSTYIDNDPTNADANLAKELYQWGVHLFVHYSGNAGAKLALWKNWASAPAFSLLGSFDEPDPTLLRMKFAELARSAYWTTAAGLYTLDSPTGSARAAGVPRPRVLYVSDTDGGLFTRLAGNPNATGSWLAKDRAVAYRATLVKKDANGVVKESAPCGRIVVVNPADVVVAIGSLARAANVVTATVTAHKLRVGDKLNLVLAGADIGNFNATNNVVTAVTATTIVWAEVAANYVNVAAVTITSGFKSVQVYPDIPAGAAVGDFVRLYRTREAASADFDPGDEMHLAYERRWDGVDPTIQDTTPSTSLGAPLKTNANTGDGPDAGFRAQPPLCRDTCVWDGRLWGANTVDRHRLTLRLLGTGAPNGLQSGDRVAVNSRVFEAAVSFGVYTQYTPTQNIERTVSDFASFVNPQLVGLSSYLEHDGDTGLGEVLFEQTTLASSLADGAGGAIDGIYAATSRVSAFADGLPALKAVTAASTARTLGTTVTVRCIAHGFVQGQKVMLAREWPGATDANFPCGLKTVATVVDADNFTYAEAGANATLGGGTPYFAYATTFKSDQYKQQVRFSRAGEPEAWPLPFTLGGLPDGVEVLRIKPSATGNQLFIALKDREWFSVSGQFPYVVRKFDNTAPLVAADSLQEHNGQLYCLTSQGNSAISESGVGIVGTDVENFTRFIITKMMASGQSLSQIFGVSYETDHQYLLFAPGENPLHPGNVSSSVIQALVLQSTLGQYTRWYAQRTCGLVWRGGDYLVMGDGVVNQLRVERKAYSYLDFVDEQLALTGSYAVQSPTTMRYTLVTGDISQVVAGDAIELPAGGGTYYRVTNTDNATWVDFTAVLAPASAAATLYRQIATLHTWAADSRGMPGVESRWRQVQLHFKEHLFSSLGLSYQGEKSATYGNVIVQDASFAFGTPVQHLTTIRAKVHDNFERVALQRISMGLNEAFSYFRLLGYSGSAEPITEKTGQ